MMFSGKMLIETKTPTEDILFLNITLSQRLISRKKKRKVVVKFRLPQFKNNMCYLLFSCLFVCLFCFVFSINLEFITF